MRHQLYDEPKISENGLFLDQLKPLQKMIRFLKKIKETEAFLREQLASLCILMFQAWVFVVLNRTYTYTPDALYLGTVISICGWRDPNYGTVCPLQWTKMFNSSEPW
jgi:hypothetical protein